MKTTWTLDAAHSTAAFSVKHMMIAKVHGGFSKLSGKLTLDSSNVAQSEIEVTIAADSIYTGDGQRDAHLKSADFFDVAKFPELTFQSRKIEPTGDGLKVIGDLTIHGVTKSVTLSVEGPSAEMKDPWGNIKMGASAVTKISRKDFGLTWNAALEAGGFLVGEEVTITLDVQFLKQAQ